MNVREMQMAFDTRIQLVSETEEIKTKPDSFTIIQFLNRAQEKYIIDNFLSKGSLQENIELIQRRSDVLRNIISRHTDTESPTPITSTEVDGGIKLSLPSDYLHYINSYSYVINSFVGNTSKVWDNNRIINHEELAKITDNLYNSPILRKPCVVFEETNTAILYKDRDTELYNTNFIYLRKPNELSLEATGNGIPAGLTDECELDSYTHLDIVELAVDMYIKEYKFLLAQGN